MRNFLLALLALTSLPAPAGTPDITIPDAAVALIRTTDFVEVKGTNMNGGAEDFSIHNAKAISQFVALLTAERYVAVPKSLKPEFRSKSAYHVRLSSKGALILELNVIADSVIDLPHNASYYMESDRHSDILLAPLLRLR